MGQMIICVTAVVLIVTVIQAVWPYLLGLAIFATLCFVAAGLFDRAENRKRAIKERYEAVAARADRQHNQVMRGDPAGTYGQYPPAEM